MEKYDTNFKIKNKIIEVQFTYHIISPFKINNEVVLIVVTVLRDHHAFLIRNVFSPGN